MQRRECSPHRARQICSCKYLGRCKDRHPTAPEGGGGSAGAERIILKPPLRYRINRLGGRSRQEKWILQAELFNEMHRWVKTDWKRIERTGTDARHAERFADADPEEGRVARWQQRLAPWTDLKRQFRADGFYERFPAKGQVERVARVSRELARVAGIASAAAGAKSE